MSQEKIWQVVAPLLILGAFLLEPSQWPLLSIVVGGLSARFLFEQKGLYWSSSVVIGTIFLYWIFFLLQHPLWHAGLCVSYCLGFWIIASMQLAEEEKSASLHAQTDALQISLGFLEEEIARLQLAGLQERKSEAAKVENLQKQVEEIQIEHSSVLMLNDVLRKRSAKYLQIQEELEKNLQTVQQKLHLTLADYSSLQEEIHEYQDQSSYVIENKSLKSTLQQIEKEGEEMQGKIVDLESSFQKGEEERRLLLQERADLESRVETLGKECASLRDQLSQIPTTPLPQDLSQYVEKSVFEEKVQPLLKIEELYTQLKKQFEEKNEILHRVRRELFLVNNEYASFQIQVEQEEKVERELVSIVFQELGCIEKDLEQVTEENRELEQLVASFQMSTGKGAIKKEKRVQKSAIQDSLLDLLHMEKRPV